MNNHNARKQDVRALIMGLSIEEKVGVCPSCGKKFEDDEAAFLQILWR